MVYSFSPFAAMVIACWLACLVLEIGFLAFDSELVGRWLRPLLAKRLARSNFSRMLQRHGIDPRVYLDTHRVNELRSDLTRCEGCAETKRCDTVLAAEHDIRDHVGFCPNRKIIEAIAHESHRRD